MALEFVESFQLEIPDIGEQLAEFAEADFSESHGLIVNIAAIHAGLTSNFNQYGEGALEASLLSWTSPYPKPIILNHDILSEPIGRVMGARMDKEADGTPFVRLQAAITDPAAIQKITDKRYLTGSVGGKAQEAVCSVCNKDWAAPKETNGLPCRHQRGKVYGGKLAYLDMKKVIFNEYSMVNIPADDRSGVVSTGVTESESDWATAANFMILDMDHEEILECTESESRDILSTMRKKEAAPLYHGMKGAYLSVLAVAEMEEKSPKPYGDVKYADPKNGKYPIDTEAHVRAAWSYINMPKNASKYSSEELARIKARIKAAAKKFGIKIGEGLESENTNLTDINELNEETLMADDALETEVEDDVLAVAEGLSDDLDKIGEESSEEEVEEGGPQDTPNDGDEPDSDTPSTEEPSGDEDATSEEADDKNHDFVDKNGDGKCDVCGANADQHKSMKTSPASGTQDGESERPEGQEKPHDKDVDPETSDGAPVSRESEQDEAAESEIEEQAEDAELSGTQEESTEPLAEELKSEIDTLKEENARLRKSLHRMLAQQVVQAKVAAGIVPAESYSDSVKEHLSRTASSLADSLRDFASVNFSVGATSKLHLNMEEKSEVVGDDEQVITIGEEESSDSKPDPIKVVEDTLVDALTGRISLQF